MLPNLWNSLCGQNCMLSKDSLSPDIEAFDDEIHSRTNSLFVQPALRSRSLAALWIEVLVRSFTLLRGSALV